MDQPSSEVWYFTFAFGGPYRSKYVRIEGSYREARFKMNSRFGARWTFQYSEKEFLSQIGELGLTELK